MTKLHQLANKMCMMCRYGCPSLGKPLSEAVRTFRFHGWSTSTYIRVGPSSTVGDGQNSTGIPQNYYGIRNHIESIGTKIIYSTWKCLDSFLY